MMLDRLQRWYAEQCDGEWEHRYGVKIGTLDNPGWLVQIDLTGTPLEKALFGEILEDTDTEGWPQSERWMHCRIVDNVWQGAGDENKLERLLDTFLSWAERAGS